MYFSRNWARGHGATSLSAQHNFDCVVLKEQENEMFEGYLAQNCGKVAKPASSPSSTVPKRLKSPADTRRSPLKSPGKYTQCWHVFVTGKEKGTQCIKRRSPTGGGKCDNHKKKTAGAAPPAKSAHGDCGKRATGAAAGVKLCGGRLNVRGSDEKFDEEEELQ